MNKFNKIEKNEISVELANEEEHQQVSHDESNWLVSYADMMTLLCGFFIMLFSMAKLDEPKFDSFKEEISKQFGKEYVSPSKELSKFAEQIIHDLGIDSTARVKADSSGISIVFESTLFFQTLSADISSEGQTILKNVIDKIYQRQKSFRTDYKIVVEGHTDGRPIVDGVYPSNWELSGARASRVVRMFLDSGFSSQKLTAIGYADTRPQLDARSADGRWSESALAKNRRVVLRILGPQVDSIPFPEGGKL